MNKQIEPAAFFKPRDRPSNKFVLKYIESP
jgi:hypothetical protein